MPVRVTVLRSGTAYSIPGRSVDLCERGIAVTLAGEVKVNDTVGLEFLLPDLGLGLQTKATVRHHSQLRCGFEFNELTRHQQAVIREWSRQRLQMKTPQATPAKQSASHAHAALSAQPDFWHSERFRKIALAVIAVLVFSALVSWWYWERGWKEIEEQVPHPLGGQMLLLSTRESPLPGSAGTFASARSSLGSRKLTLLPR